MNVLLAVRHRTTTNVHMLHICTCKCRLRDFKISKVNVDKLRLILALCTWAELPAVRKQPAVTLR